MLQSALKQYRLQQARSKSLPAYCIFTNKVLDEIVAKRPSNMPALLAIQGFGHTKGQQYGTSIIRICQQHKTGNHRQQPTNRRSFSTPSFSAASSGYRQSSSSITPGNVQKEMQAQLERSRASPASSGVVRIKKETLNAEQQVAAAYAQNGGNCFLSGPAGTGKSFLLRFIIQELQAVFGDDLVAVTAPTGIAATNVSGITIHSWSGVGLAKGQPQAIVQKVQNSPAACASHTIPKVIYIRETFSH